MVCPWGWGEDTGGSWPAARGLESTKPCNIYWSLPNFNPVLQSPL